METSRPPHPARHAFSLAGSITIALVAFGVFAAAVLYSNVYVQSGQMASVVSAVLVDLANDDRTDKALGTLAVNPKLTAAAKAKAEDMAAKGYFAHVSPDGRTSWSWFEDAGYTFSHAGENLAVDFSDSDDVERAWMNSPTHRANIMNGAFTEIGIATATGIYEGRKTTFVVQMFGTPALGTTAPVRTLTQPSGANDIAIATTEEDEDVLGAASAEPTKTADAIAPSNDTPGVETPAAAPAVQQSAPTSVAPAWGEVASSPKSVLHMIYILMAFMLLIALVLTTRLEFKRHHLRHMVLASCLLFFMGTLSLVADRVVFPEPLLAQAVLAAP